MPDNSTIKRALMSWGTGRPYLPPTDGAAAVIVVEAAEHVGAVLASDVVGPDTVLFVPDTTQDGVADRATVVRYQGDPAEPATELTVGDDIYVQLQDYGTAEYISLIGPTLIRMSDPADFPAYLEDLDRAVGDGRFAEYAVHPAAQLADQAGLGAELADDGPRLRLHLAADGSWSISTAGAALGVVGDDWATINRQWQRHQQAAELSGSLGLAKVIGEQDRIAALQKRPWAGHYLSALAAHRDLVARHVADPSISGFGARLAPELADAPTVGASRWPAPRGADPVLAWTEEQAFLHLPDTARTFQLPLQPAAVVEVLLVCGSVAAAEQLLPRARLLDVAEQLTGFGIEVGDQVSDVVG